MCCARSLKIQDAKSRHFGTIAQLCRAVSSQLRHVSTIGKNTLNSNTSSMCPHTMVNFGLRAAEICWRVWGTPANFNGFRVLAALLHGTVAMGISQTSQRWTAPPIFGRAAITLGIGPNSSSICIRRRNLNGNSCINKQQGGRGGVCCFVEMRGCYSYIRHCLFSSDTETLSYKITWIRVRKITKKP